MDALADKSQTIVVNIVADSAVSNLAMSAAIAMAKTTPTRLVLVHAYTPAEQRTWGVENYLKDDIYLIRGATPAEEVLRLAAEQIDGNGLRTTDRRAVRGDPVKALATVAGDIAADFIVIADPKPHRRWSLAEAVWRKSGIAVISALPDGCSNSTTRDYHRTCRCRSKELRHRLSVLTSASRGTSAEQRQRVEHAL
ncbi:universal stress protein [Nocardia sp. NBC_00508]|uniref:universal stress protein n=1 Tax=Nocardia sp. NBC_00508 TaxID=2975992 RepID=UPI002E80FC50|nr:universal stress protein [Nocardia sp. NBC_00508]WUD64700.1 universal stress protein [Nocardia sp. NBC_00508]